MNRQQRRQMERGNAAAIAQQPWHYYLGSAAGFCEVITQQVARAEQGALRSGAEAAMVEERLRELRERTEQLHSAINRVLDEDPPAKPDHGPDSHVG